MFSNKSRIIWLFVAFVGGLLLSSSVSAQEIETDEPVVQAVLFYSPTCPHCHEVITNFMIPLMEEYSTQLDVLGIDVSTEGGNYLYNNAIAFFEIPENRLGVPTLIYQDTVLVGGLEIPNEFPGLVEAGLAAGGVGWPAIPELATVVGDLPLSADPNQMEDVTPITIPTTEAEVASVEEVVTAVPEPPVIVENEDPIVQSIENIDTTAMTDTEPIPSPDPIGFALGWLVLLGLFAVLLFCFWQLGSHWAALTQADAALNQDKGRSMFMWILIVLGLIVSAYLAYVETMNVTAVCGPVGECNLVQSSPYAQIMGIPIAVLGLLFYLTVAGLWLLQRVEKVRHWVVVALVALAIFGTLFSLYLTLIELLVIGAICMWCLTSAVVTGLICLLVTIGVVKRPLPPEPQVQVG